MCVYIYIYIHIYLHIYIYICVCVWVLCFCFLFDGSLCVYEVLRFVPLCMSICFVCWRVFHVKTRALRHLLLDGTFLFLLLPSDCMLAACFFLAVEIATIALPKPSTLNP